MPSAQVAAIEWGNGAGDISPGEHAPHLLAGRDPRGVLRFGQPPEPLRCLIQGPGHDRVVDVLEPVQPSHHGLVRLEHRDGARILPLVLEGHDELAEYRRGVRCQLQGTCQRPDRQVAEAVVNARVAEGVEQPRVLGAGVVPGVGHRGGGLRQVVELGESRGSLHQPRDLVQRQRVAGAAQVPQQAPDIACREQVPCLLKLLGHAHTLASASVRGRRFASVGSCARRCLPAAARRRGPHCRGPAGAGTVRPRAQARPAGGLRRAGAGLGRPAATVAAGRSPGGRAGPAGS